MNVVEPVSLEKDPLDSRLLRIDLQESLQQSNLDPRKLSSFQRILLTTDGTVTEILEAQLWEAIKIIKVEQEILKTESSNAYLEIDKGADVILRKVLLRGKTSHKNYIYAESITVIDRLSDELKDGLANSKKGLGQLMLESRLETFREILKCRRIQAEDLAEYFGVKHDSHLITRTYRVFANRKPLMLITETFPEDEFLD